MDRYVLVGLSVPARFELEPGFNTIGRNATNDFRIHDANVSSFHCEVVVGSDALMVHDLGSTNGTFVDGQRIDECRILPNQILRLGGIELRLEAQPQPDPLPRVAIPSTSVPSAAIPANLADGHPACRSHPAVHAVYRCARCQKFYCTECVHVLRLAGGHIRVFCPGCSGICESLQLPEGITAPQPTKKPSVFGRLTQTIRIRFK
jgi:hypothetical protein